MGWTNEVASSRRLRETKDFKGSNRRVIHLCPPVHPNNYKPQILFELHYNWSFQVHRAAEDKYLTPILLHNLPGKAPAQNLLRGLASAALRGTQKKEHPLLSSKQHSKSVRNMDSSPMASQKRCLSHFHLLLSSSNDSLMGVV